MVVCSVSTVVFNANPLMRYDGYYVLADWIEIPNLRERSNRYLSNLFQEHCLGIEVQPEQYMALWRRWLFVIYAVTSWIYRWVVTFFILYFLYNFLRPYKLGVISAMLAIAALASMIGWPLFRLAKNIHRRGRLPDMKPVRVTITCTVIVGLILAILFVPLPVSRVTAVGVVQIEPEAREPVYVAMAQGDNKAILREIFVKDGERVEKGDRLARFSNRKYDEEMETARLQRNAFKTKLVALKGEFDKTQNPREKGQLYEEILRTREEHDGAHQKYVELEQKIKQQSIVRAPIGGVVMSPPKIDVVDKLWDYKQPFCKIGDPERLRVLIPVEPADYNLLQENLRQADKKVLPVSVRVPGMDRQFWYGEVTTLPPAEATNIPIELSSKTDGPVPVIPGDNPEQLVPQTQQYLVAVALVDADAQIHPGVRAKVKIHCKKRSMGWYIWRSINDTFNLRLI
jgi:putative peptide zinc metalloprotease protein